MLLDKEGRDKAEFVLGLNILDSFREKVIDLKRSLLLAFFIWLLMTVSFSLWLVRFSMSAFGIVTFILGMIILWMASYYPLKESIETIEGLIDFADKQETELEVVSDG